MAQKRFLVRSIVAVLLMIGFYALALSISGTFLYLAWMQIASDHKSIRALIMCLIAGGTILWSIIPRRDVFGAPGPQIFERDQPELFRLIGEVAAATNQAMPDEVYVTGEVNAWVAHRGGSMGVGTRRVMGLGLPLMQTLTTSQFRAVLAHEFGHYVAGDTKLAPVIYKTREAIGRTVENVGGILHKPFLWYGKLYLRVTQAISRAQELAADELSAKVAGARNAAAALETVHRAALAYEFYWRGEVVPLLERGFKPPIAHGFHHFMNVAHVDNALKEDVQRELREGKGDAYDSHPPLRERVRALKAMRGGDVNPEEPMTVTLVRDVAQLERQMLSSIDEHAAAALQEIPWEESPRVFVKMWKEETQPHTAALRELKPEEFGRVAGSMSAFAARLQLRDVPAEERTSVAAGVIACAFAARLHDSGWTWNAVPGEPVRFVQGEHTIRPFEVLPKLMRGELAAEEWNAQCRAAGIDRLTLT
jgi:Zn-dependent protease with chaperone function